MTAVRVAIGMGANLGDRLGALRGAVRGLEAVVGGLEVSPVYETAPVHIEEQPAFLNAVAVGETALEPGRLLGELLSLEERLGRKRTGRRRYGPRRIDLDLLLYGSVVMRTDDLIVPHPRLIERAFVLVPLADVAADWRIPDGVPGGGRTIGELARDMDDVGVTRTEVQLEENTH